MKPTRRVRRRKQTRRKRRGGKKLGEGYAGIVIDPAIPCKGKDTKGYVSKVFKIKEEFEKLKSRQPVFMKLKEIDPQQQRFLYPETCDIDLLLGENIRDGVTQENMRDSYLMKKGSDLTLYDSLKKNATYERTNQEVVDYIVGPLRNVFENVNFLHKHGILHEDLHTRNILINEDGTSQIIDFDRALLLTDKDMLAMLLGKNSILRSANAKIQEAKSNEMQGLIEEVTILLKSQKPDIIFIIEEVYERLGLD
jgi:serine/threonine protein kinase